MSIQSRPISKSFDIGRFFQDKTQKVKYYHKVSPLKTTFIKFAKPQIFTTINGEQFPQMIFKKIKMNFRIISRKGSFNQNSVEGQQTNKLNQKQSQKNPQKLFFYNQDQEQSVDEQFSPIKLNDILIQEKNFIPLNIKTLTLDQHIQKDPINLFRNQILKQKFNQKLKTQECPEINQQKNSIQDKPLVYSTLIKKRLNQRKGQLAKSQLRRILNSKELNKKDKFNFKISNSKKLTFKNPTKIMVPALD